MFAKSVAAAILAAAPAAQAALIAYEGFDYSPATVYTGTDGVGESILGYNGGTGWGAAWANNPALTNAGASMVAASGLTYSSGGNTLVSAGYSAADNSGGAHSNQRQWFTTGGTSKAVNTIMPASSIWFSVLIRPVSATSAIRFDPFARTISGADAGTGFIFNVAATPTIAAQVGVKTDSPTTVLGTAGGGVTLVVGRVDFTNYDTAVTDSAGSTNGTVYIWANPAIGGSVPLDTAASSINGGVVLSNGLLTTRSNSGYRGMFDEFRVGTTFADVTPVPEPTILGLAGLAGTFLMSRRRSA